MIFSKYKKTVIIVLVFIALLIIYGIYWNVSFSRAKELYYDKQYSEAKEKLDHLLYFGGNLEFDKIICSGKTLWQYQEIQKQLAQEINPEYKDDDIRVKAEIIALLLINAKYEINKYIDNKDLEDRLGDIIITYLLQSQELGVEWGKIKVINPNMSRYDETERIKTEILKYWNK